MPVYMIRAGVNGPVKIGKADDPARRLCEIQVCNSEDLSLLRVLEGGLIEEMALHVRFADLHIRGEWFHFSRQMLGDVGLQEIQPAFSRNAMQIQPGCQKLRDWLKANKLTKFDVAQTLGVSHTTVGRWCTGEIFPSRDKMVAIKALTSDAVTPDDFLPIVSEAA